jgi:hypothetical protein
MAGNPLHWTRMRTLIVAAAAAMLTAPWAPARASVPVLTKPQITESAPACADSALPEGVRAALANDFAAWRVQTVTDLDADYQKEWTAKRAGGCPGIAAGHFESKSADSFAVLLIPREKGKPGYRLAVFSPAGKDGFRSVVLEQSDEYIPSDSGIFRVEPGLQFNEEKFAAFKLKSDGIYLETYEKGGYIYYWKRGKYERVLESD